MLNCMREKYISVDIESSGPIPGEYSLLTIGACLVDDDSTTFAASLKPLNRNAVPEAMSVSGLSLDELERTGQPPAEAMAAFGDWIAQATQDGTKAVFVGLNAPFDWSFVNYYFHRFAGGNPFGFTALDIKALYMGATGCTWDQTGSSKIAKRLSPKRNGTHDALEDALYQAELFRLTRSISSRQPH
jgi:DNA polymerase III epsilon subunit-like protein